MYDIIYNIVAYFIVIIMGRFGKSPENFGIIIT